jgi:hypothetical protein
LQRDGESVTLKVASFQHTSNERIVSALPLCWSISSNIAFELAVTKILTANTPRKAKL